MPRRINISRQTLAVLELLLRDRSSWHYGYAISQEIGIKSGTLYPLLIRLASQGWLETKWAEPDEPGRPRRHTYRLTGDGAREARSRLSEMRTRSAPTPRLTVEFT